MQVHASASQNGLNYAALPVNNSKDNIGKDTDDKIFNAAGYKYRHGNSSSAVKGLFHQIEQLQKTIEKIKENEKLSREDQLQQVLEIQKQIQELQKQIIETERQEQEEKIKEREEKRSEEEMKHLSAEEQERRAQEAQQKMMTQFAGAADHLKSAVPFYFQVKKYTTQAQMGMGSKYKGNLSSAEVGGLFNEAARYGKAMMKELNTASKLAKSASRASEEYQKHKRAENELKAEESENGEEQIKPELQAIINAKVVVEKTSDVDNAKK